MTPAPAGITWRDRVLMYELLVVVAVMLTPVLLSFFL